LRIRYHLLFASMLLISSISVVRGAQDGQFDMRSQGQIVVRLTIEQGIQITQLRDVQLNINMASAQANAVYAQRFCVRSNLQANYRMTAFSDQGGSAPFTLTSPGGDTLTYWLYFSGNLSSSVLGQLYPAVPSQTFRVTNNGINCNGQNNAELKLTIPASELLRARDREYSGFLNLSVGIE
jgi:hypothetical protein